LFFLFVIGLGIKAQRRKPVTGLEAMTGLTGVSLSMLNPLGSVKVHGELWKAESVSGNIEEGKNIRVTGVKDLKLFVEEF
jgi:membrane-bound serine protease (ClpP class)